MAASIAALTAGGGGLQSTSDASGNLNLVSGTTTIVAMTSAGVAVTGTLTASGTTTLVTPVLGTPASGNLANCTGYPVVSQAQMETGTDNTAMVTPLAVNWHQGVAKCWLKANAAGTIQVSYNITSITDGGVGLITVTIGTDFSSVNYVVQGTALYNGIPDTVNVTSQAAGSFTADARQNDGALFDPTNWFFVCWGDQ